MSPEQLIVPEDLIGSPSREFIFWLVKENPQITQFNFHFYRDRISNPPDFKEKITTKEDDLIVIDKGNLSADKIEDLLSYGYKRNSLLAIRSSIILQNGKIGQIPMVDFNCEINDQNGDLIKRLMKEMNLPSFLIVSGNSYHTVSKKLFIDDNRGWEQFLGKCLLSNLADYRNIGHSLDKGYSALRISHNEKGFEPMIIGTIL